LEYLPNTKAELIQVVEDGIRRRLEKRRQVYPWLKIELQQKVVRPRKPSRKTSGTP